MSMDSLIKKALAKQPTIKPRTKRNAQPEAIEQAKVIAWARTNENNYPYLWMLHSSLNGLKRTKNAQGKAKQQGMLSGVPDLFLPVKNNHFNGLYIEMKSAKGRVSVEQSRFLKCAADNGYSVVVCYSAGEAIKRIEDYMSKIQENATQIDGWILITDHLPNVGDKVEIMHFGNDEDGRIYDTAKMTAWGVHPDNDRGGHGKMSTVTHWRHLSI